MTSIKKYTDEELRKLHSVLYELLGEVDRICRKHDIRYFIIGGTAIGAHFWDAIIPWDDDIDIGMSRRNYERFLEVAQQEMGEKYFLQTPDTDKHAPFFFAKVRKNGTIFSESQFQHIDMHQGIFVDIFPFDMIPDDARKEKHQHDMLHFLNGLFIAHDIWQWEHCGQCEVETPRKRSFLACLATRIIITLLPKRCIYKMMIKVQTWYNRRSDLTFCKNIITENERLPLSDAENPQEVNLGELEVFAPLDMIGYLHAHYGTICKDLPEEQRINHRPAQLKF